jgi:hypothetical protein
MKLNALARAAHLLAGAALVLLGLYNAGFRPRAYPLGSFGALWFTGTALMTLVAGVMNLVAARTRSDRLLLWATFLVDLLGGTYAFWVTRMLRQSQAWVGLAAFALAAACALYHALQATRRAA